MSNDPRTWRDRINAARAEGLAAREYFVVLTEPAADKQAVRDMLPRHLEYQRTLEREDRLVAAGPLSDETGQDWTGKGLIILRAQSLEDARQVAANDPMHGSGARNYVVLPWLMNEGSFALTVKLASQEVSFT